MPTKVRIVKEYLQKASCHHVRLGVLLSQSKTAGKSPEARRTAWKRSFPTPSEQAWPLHHLELELLASIIVRQQSFVF